MELQLSKREMQVKAEIMILHLDPFIGCDIKLDDLHCNFVEKLQIRIYPFYSFISCIFYHYVKQFTVVYLLTQNFLCIF